MSAKDTPHDPKERVEKLRAAFEGVQKALVLAHDNPDPDALGSAFALCAVLRHLGVPECAVGYGGIIGRAENRAMVSELGLSPVRLEAQDFDDYDAIALVDTQPDFGNNSFPSGRPAAAVIDHHPRRGPSLDNVTFVDLREGYGATATIVFEYVQASGVPLDETFITALFYAIKSETQELGREAGYADREAYLALLPRADKAAVARIQRARVPRGYFRAFELAIANARVHGRTVVTDLKRVDGPDLVAEIADFLLRLEGADWAVCMGEFENDLLLSLRTAEEDAHAGEVIRRVVAGTGRAGGHGTMAGGRVPLEGRGYAEVADEIRERLLDVLGGGSKPGEPLVVTGDPDGTPKRSRRRT